MYSARIYQTHDVIGGLNVSVSVKSPLVVIKSNTNLNFVLLYSYNVLVYFFFFFQAEDGIRDYKVTGVQTCALPICTTDYGDDKDRVVRKSDQSYTYFVPDVAYHVTKWQRGYKRVINVQGTDHQDRKSVV